MSSADLRKLANDLRRGADKARREVKGVVSKGALNVKKDWSRGLAQRAPIHAPRLSNAVNYDVRGGNGTAHAEIGPDKRRPQGALGNLTEFGSENNPAGKEGEKALQFEELRFHRAMRNLGDPLG